MFWLGWILVVGGFADSTTHFWRGFAEVGLGAAVLAANKLAFALARPRVDVHQHFPEYGE